MLRLLFYTIDGQYFLLRHYLYEGRHWQVQWPKIELQVDRSTAVTTCI